MVIVGVILIIQGIMVFSIRGERIHLYKVLGFIHKHVCQSVAVIHGPLKSDCPQGIELLTHIPSAETFLRLFLSRNLFV